jgi:hypothetical protein
MQITCNNYVDEDFNSVRIVDCTDFEDGDEAAAIAAVYERFADVDAIPGRLVLASRCEMDPFAGHEVRTVEKRPGVTMPPGLQRRIRVAIVWTIAAELAEVG